MQRVITDFSPATPGAPRSPYIRLEMILRARLPAFAHEVRFKDSWQIIAEKLPGIHP